MNREQHEKINPAIAENTECSIVEMRDSFIDLKVSVSLDHGVSLCFVLLLALRTCWKTFQACWEIFQAKHKKRSC